MKNRQQGGGDGKRKQGEGNPFEQTGKFINTQKISRGETMSWKEIYKSKLMKAEDAAKIVKSGDRFWTPLCLGQPSMLIMDALAARKSELKDVDYNYALLLRPYKILQPEYRDTFTLIPAFYSGTPPTEVATTALP